jgi:L-alanine-DL-glutamate epimerase-like enolase superfamily enzyme
MKDIFAYIRAIRKCGGIVRNIADLNAHWQRRTDPAILAQLTKYGFVPATR